MANDKSVKGLTDSTYWRGALTRNLRCGHCLVLLLLVSSLSSLLHSCDARNITTGNITTDSQALLEFKKAADPAGHVLRTWKVLNETCTRWLGVSCNKKRVYQLRLNNLGLSGTVKNNTLSKLGALRYLSMQNNSFTGSIPGDLPILRGLATVNLQNAQFSGRFPQFKANTKIKYMHLTGNNLSGPIPDLSALKFILHLDLSVNSFNGSLPGNLPPRIEILNLRNNSFSGNVFQSVPANLSSLDLSYNQLSGPIPPALAARFPNAFAGNLGLCGPPTSNLCPGNPTSSSRHSSRLSTRSIIIIVVATVLGLLFLLLLLGLLAYLYRRRNRRRPGADQTLEEHGLRRAGSSKLVLSAATGGGGAIADSDRAELIFVEGAPYKFDLEDLFRASADILGKGTLGTSYRARLGSGDVVVVKRLKDVKDMPRTEFEKQMTVLGQIRHPNLLPLRAYYWARDEKLLVYDYMFTGSLASVLHGSQVKGSTQAFDWDARLKVAYDVALALSFLHEKCPSDVFPHQNLKSNNVILEDKFGAYLSDFCLFPLMPPKVVQGMTGYAAPEYNNHRSKKKGNKADIYSYGVLLLELLTGRRPAQSSSGRGTDLPDFVKAAVREEWTVEVFDLRLQTSKKHDAEMVTILQLAVRCVEDNPDLRPPLTQVIEVLEDMLHGRGDVFVDSQTRDAKHYDSSDYDYYSKDDHSKGDYSKDDHSKDDYTKHDGGKDDRSTDDDGKH